MGQIRIMRTETVITDTNVTITSTFQNQQLIDVVTRDGSEDTNTGAKYVAHKNACESVTAAMTSPPITSTPIGNWVKSKNSTSTVTVSGTNETLSVPTGNPGTIKFNVAQNDGTAFQYSKNGGAWTTVVDGNTITIVTGDKINLQCTGLAGAGAGPTSCQGTITDNSTGIVIDNFWLQNTNFS